METVYDLHQHTHCVAIYIGKKDIAVDIFSTANRCFNLSRIDSVELDSFFAFNKQRINATGFGWDFEKRGENDIGTTNLRDGLYNLFKKNKKAWDEDDKFLSKTVSDRLLAAVKKSMGEMRLKTENFNFLHYVFVVPSEWEEEIRADIIRPIFVQSGLISKEDHQDRLLFFTDIESFCYYYKYFFRRGQNTILCRISPEEEKHIIKFDLIQTTTTLFNFPNASLFPKVTSSSSVSVTAGEIEGRIEDFLREKLFPASTTNDGGRRSLAKSWMTLTYQDQIIEAIVKGVNSEDFPSLDEENRKKDPKKKPWIIIRKRWMLSESQKDFIESLCPSIICAGIGADLLNYMKDIISNNFTKSYRFLLVRDNYSDWSYKVESNITWLKYILEYNRRSLNHNVKITSSGSRVELTNPKCILQGAGMGVFEAIQHSDIYCKPREVSPVNPTTCSSVFINSKPDAIINLDISLGSTLFTCSLLDEDGSIKQIFNHDYFIKNNLPPLGNFYTLSDTATLKVKEKFIPFAERYLLGDLSDFTFDNGASIKKDTLLEIKGLLTNDFSKNEVLVSTNKQKYIKAFISMYMIYIKEEILHKLPEQLVSNQMNMKIGYAVSIEAIILNNTVGSKDNLKDIIFASGLVPKDDNYKKLRITTQGERALPAIQKSLKLELSLKSYFLLCQLHEDYVQLSLHQVVTTSSPEEKEQESIIVQDEVVSIRNIYDYLCSNMWCNLLQDSSLIELCEVHNTGNSSKALDLFSSKIKTEFFANLKGHISENVLQNNPMARSTNAIKLNSSCNCKVRLTTADIIDICFTPVLQDVACTLSTSLLNKEVFGDYMNIDYLFSIIRFNNNPQLQYAFARILEEEADDFNLESGIETTCLAVPELFNQLSQPVIKQQPFCYKDFIIGVLQQVCNENCVIAITQDQFYGACPIYKSKATDTKFIECCPKTAFPLLSKGDIINNVRSNRRFYLQNKKDSDFDCFNMDLYKLKTMNYLENNETLSLDDNSYHRVDGKSILLDKAFKVKHAAVPVMISIGYESYSSSLQFSMKIVGDDWKRSIIKAGEPLTLTRF